jgi:hypothetical protein
VIDDVQADVGDAIASAQQAIDALACAEDCESAEDLRANLKEACAALRVALGEASDLLTRAKRAKD